MTKLDRVELIEVVRVVRWCASNRIDVKTTVLFKRVQFRGTGTPGIKARIKIRVAKMVVQ